MLSRTYASVLPTMMNEGCAANLLPVGDLASGTSQDAGKPTCWDCQSQGRHASLHVGGAMLCPFCGSDATRVIDSRADSVGRVRKRRCPECGHAFTTVERIATESLMVKKRDGRLEDFSRAKLVRGITKASHLYALPPPDVDAFVDRVVGMLQPSAPGFPISSTEIGRTVLQELQDSRAITDVARIRYALVFLGQRDRS